MQAEITNIQCVDYSAVPSRSNAKSEHSTTDTYMSSRDFEVVDRKVPVADEAGRQAGRVCH